jgi:hypothetical protein
MCDCRERIPDCALEPRNKSVIAVCDFKEVLVESVTSRVDIVLDWRELGDQILAPMRTQLAISKIHSSVGNVQKPRIGVKIGRPNGDSRLRLREGQHASDS